MAPVAGKITGGRHADVTSIVYASISEEVHEAYVFSIHGFKHLHRYLLYANCVMLGMHKVGKPILMLNAYGLIRFWFGMSAKAVLPSNASKPSVPNDATHIAYTREGICNEVFNKLFCWCHDS